MLFALFVTAPASTTAAPLPSIDMQWKAPPGCPQESDVRDRIQKILGSGRHDSPLQAEGTITRIDKRFRLELVVRVRDVVGTRSIESNSCEDLAGAAAVEIGLLVHSVEAAGKPNQTGTQPPTSPPVTGPETSGTARRLGTGATAAPQKGQQEHRARDAAASQRVASDKQESGTDGANGLSSQGTSDVGPAEGAPDSAKTERKTEVESEATEPPPPAESQRHWHALVKLPLVALGVGPLPRPSRGVGLSLGFEHAGWQLHLQGLFWQRQNVPAADFPGYGADVDRITAALWACRELRLSWFGLSPCLAAGMERVSARGTGSNILPTPRHSIGMSAGAGIQGRIHLARWLRLLAAVGGQVELVRPQISIKGLGLPAPSSEGAPTEPASPTPVYRFAPAALTATLGLEWAL